MRNLSIILSLTIIFSLMAPAVAVQPEDQRINVIIGFKGSPDIPLIAASGGEIKYQFDIIPAVAVNIPSRALNGLEHNPEIAYIDPDISVRALGEVLPWGVDRIDADIVWGDGGVPVTKPGTDTGAGVNVAIIDTGIDMDHPDLSANIKGGRNFVRIGLQVDPARWDDDNGHGSHVAGIVAALDNEIGVIGVAPGANLYAVKVLDRNGNGYLSDVVAGIDWAAKNNMDVISMSLGASSGADSLQQACSNANNAGIILIGAAGNNAGAVLYPAAYDSVMAVSATVSGDNLASYSNYGNQIELAAPGSSVYSTYKGGAYATMSGTSMAAPHVTGAAALVIASNITKYRGHPDLVRSQLTSTAEDLGSPGWDRYFGYGLVDAQSATPGQVINPPPPPQPAGEMHVAGITMTSGTQQKGKSAFYLAYATVTVVNSTGTPVEGAAVYGQWSGRASNAASGTTDINGAVALISDSSRKSGTFTFTVTNIVLGGWTYQASANIETSDSITI